MPRLGRDPLVHAYQRLLRTGGLCELLERFPQLQWAGSESELQSPSVSLFCVFPKHW